MSILTNLGKNAISSALGSETKLNLVKIGFGDKLGNINKVFTESDVSLVNEKIRMNLDTVTYSDVTENNNSILTITAILTPEQSFNMEAITIREFGIYDNSNNLIIVGNTVPTITRDESNGNGINFEISIVLPTTEKIVRIINNGNEFNDAFKNKLNKIEEEATKNMPDDFLLNRENHTGSIKIENVLDLIDTLSQLVTNESLGQALGEKVSVVPGKDLSTNDYTDDDKEKLDSINIDTLSQKLNEVEDLKDIVDDKVSVVPGKDLSTNDYTDDDKNKLDSIDINFIYDHMAQANNRPHFLGQYDNLSSLLEDYYIKDDLGEGEGIPEDKEPLLNNSSYYNSTEKSVMYYINSAWINSNDVIDNLVTGDSKLPLSANQGKILKGLIDNITTILNSDETNLDTIQEIVDFIKINRDTLNALTISSIAGLQNALNNKLDKNQNAVSATKLATARTIGGVSFDGTANINLPGVNITGNQNTTGNAATATVLNATDNRAIKPVNLTNSALSHYFTSQGGLTATADSAYGDLIALDSYSDSTGGAINGLFLDKKTKRILHYQAPKNATTWGTPHEIAYNTNNVIIQVPGNNGNKIILNANEPINKAVLNNNTSIELVGFTNGRYFEVLLELINGGNFAITWLDNINWCLSDGTTTTNFGDTGVFLNNDGTPDFIYIWSTSSGVYYGKVLR